MSKHLQPASDEVLKELKWDTRARLRRVISESASCIAQYHGRGPEEASWRSEEHINLSSAAACCMTLTHPVEGTEPFQQCPSPAYSFTASSLAAEIHSTLTKQPTATSLQEFWMRLIGAEEEAVEYRPILECISSQSGGHAVTDIMTPLLQMAANAYKLEGWKSTRGLRTEV